VSNASAGADEESRFVRPAERLIREEEPESLRGQPAGESDHPGDGVEADDRLAGPDENASDRESPHDVDPVRSYLNEIGRRRLLTAAEEQAIGRPIEEARADLLVELASVPAALQTLVALAEAVRRGEAPATELVLLPDGGELEPGKVEPVLDAFAAIRRLQRRISDWQRRCDEGRSSKALREAFRSEVGAAQRNIGAILRELPIRPRSSTRSSRRCAAWNMSLPKAFRDGTGRQHGARSKPAPDSHGGASGCGSMPSESGSGGSSKRSAGWWSRTFGWSSRLRSGMSAEA
jgi:hypothetical protein